MNYTDQSAGAAEFTLYLTPAGKDLNGEPLYTMASFATVRLSDNTDSTGTFVQSLPWDHPLAEAYDNNIRFRIEMVSGAIPAPQPNDTDQRALHFIGAF